MNAKCKSRCPGKNFARRYAHSDPSQGNKWGCFTNVGSARGEFCVTEIGERLYCNEGNGDSCKNSNINDDLEGTISEKEDYCPGKIISFVMF